MQLTTERLTLVPMCERFIDSTHEYASDPENTRFMVFLPNDSLEETIGYIRLAEAEFAKPSPSFYEFAVLLEEKHIGAVSLYLDDSRQTAEFGWIINKRYHGQGFAFEAAKALLGYANETLGIRHFTATCDTENTPSRRVMEKLGMKLVAEYSGRKNKLSDEDRRGYEFELYL